MWCYSRGADGAPRGSAHVEAEDAIEEHGVAWLVARADPHCAWPERAKELLAALVFDCIRIRQKHRLPDMGVVLERLRAVRAVVDATGAVPLRACVVCLEEVAAMSGIACAGGGGGGASHFLCLGCLPGVVGFNLDPRKLAANGGGVRCPGEGCGHMWAIEDLEEHLDKKTLVAYSKALRYQLFDAARARR